MEAEKLREVHQLFEQVIMHIFRVKLLLSRVSKTAVIMYLNSFM